MNSDFELFLQGVEALNIALSDHQKGQFKAYMGEVALFNKRLKLVAAEGRDFVIKHLLDALTPLEFFKAITSEKGKALKFCDAGSGAGLPGIPLAIVLDELHFSLIERSGRRAGFLRNAVTMTQLTPRVEVLEQDIAEVQEGFDCITFRAFLPLKRVIEPLGKILNKGGVIGAYKGRMATLEAEINALGQGWESQIYPLSVPFLTDERSFCLLKRRGE
ncbi:MAG: 16S rRNA (guanine(527)-N(7))-methyltransferase RsmG [Sphaerochaetaceae bacterium]